MPELPEVETVMRGLAPALTGKRIERVEKRRENLRFVFPQRFVERLEGSRVKALSRRAKYILADLDSGETLILHLGMSGSFRIDAPGERSPGAFVHRRSKLAAHDHVVFDLSGGGRVTYNDPRRFGFMLLAPTRDLAAHPLFADIGVEPLSDAFDAAALANLLAGKAAPLKAALLDQRLIAGLGNIYVSEALHRAALSPLRSAGSVVKANGAPRVGATRLAAAIPAILQEAIRAGGSTLRDHQGADGTLGYFQHSFAVYGKEGATCPRPGCKGMITRIVQSGRSTFYCPTCQK
jgi:formamidopyrimidine-DNA glycosylase